MCFGFEAGSNSWVETLKSLKTSSPDNLKLLSIDMDRHTLDIVGLVPDQHNKVSQSFCWWRVLSSICKKYRIGEEQ